MKEWMDQADPEWMVGRYSFHQMKWHATLKNGRLEVVSWKKYIIFAEMWCFE